MFNGGLQARDQGQLDTCYSESSTRLILKLFKHPSIQLLGDIKDKISFEELQNFENAIVKKLKNVDVNINEKKYQDNDDNKLYTFTNTFLKSHYNPNENPPVIQQDQNFPIPENFKEAMDNLSESYTNLREILLKKIELKTEMNELEKKTQNLNIITENLKKEHIMLLEIFNKNNTEENSDKHNNARDAYEKSYDTYINSSNEYYTKIQEYNDLGDKFVTYNNNHKNSYNYLFKLNDQNKIIKKKTEFSEDNTPEITKLFNDRQKFVNNRPDLKQIIDDQNKHFNEINNFFISKIGIDGGSVKDIIDWFMNYVNNKSNFNNNNNNNNSNYVDKLRKAIIGKNKNPDNTCKLWNENINKIETNCTIDYEFLYTKFKNFHNKLKSYSLMLEFEDVYYINNKNNNENKIIKKIQDVIDNKKYLVALSHYSTNSLFENVFTDINRLDELIPSSRKSGYCNNGNQITGHAIVITGYDDDNNFILKNSWGYKWGEFGKLKIKKDIFLKTLCVTDLYTINIINMIENETGPITNKNMVPFPNKNRNMVPFPNKNTKNPTKGGISKHKYQTKRNRRIKAVMNRKKSTKKNTKKQNVKPF